MWGQRMKKQARAASWQDVKAILSQQSPRELLQLIRDLYALRPEVKDFIQARFLRAKANVAPYKKTIHPSLYPDVIHGEDIALARGRKAISEYKKATNDPVGTLELMVYYVECGNQFTVDYGDIDEEFYESLDSMFTQVVKTLQKSDLRCGKVDIEILSRLRTRAYRNHAILGVQGGEPWIASSCGHAMGRRCVRPLSWVRLRTSRRPVKS